MLPTIRQLEYLTALADTLSFRQAARLAGVTQPGLSTQIRALESTVGVELVERGRSRVLLTAAGRDLAARARLILADLHEAVETVGSRREPLTGKLRLGVIPTIAPYVLPRVLPSVRARHPELRLILREEPTRSLVERIESGEIDLGLVALEADLGRLETFPLFCDPFLVVVPRSHPLGGRKRIRENEIPASEVLLLEDGHCLGEQILTLCRRSGVRELGDFRASSLTTLLQMVSSGIGITLLPLVAREAESRRAEELRFLRFVGSRPARTIALAWRSSTTRRTEFELFGREFLRHADALGLTRAGAAKGR